jgi:hypothetical protein
MPTSYCDAPSPTFPSPGCCGHTCTVSPEPECKNCGQVPSLESPHAGRAYSICMFKAGHRSKHSWEKYGYGN